MSPGREYGGGGIAGSGVLKAALSWLEHFGTWNVLAHSASGLYCSIQ